MFDRVMFVCPNCGEQLEAQSIAGSCTMETYTSHAVPLKVADSIIGVEMYCVDCESYLEIQEGRKPLPVKRLVCVEV